MFYRQTETVQAEELTVDSKVAQIQGESIIPRADQVPGNEELFAQYVEQTFYGEESESYRTPAVYGNIGQNVLTGADKYVYNELKKIAANIADGKAADGSEPSGQYVSTKFTLSVAGQGITYEGGAFKGFSLSKVIAALLADCPYDLYWYNKTASTWFNGRISGREVVEIDINFPAADAYAGPEIEQQYKTKCTVDSKKTGAASSAAENARKIIEKHKAEKDYEKMESYKEEICDLTSYNYDAVKPGVAYGDPWQMIYVFDGDESTNVVCEGYAKAFQYLCDMSDFLDPGYNCCSVTGMMWEDAAEFILLGSTTLQVTTSIMQYGYRIVEDMKNGLMHYMEEQGVDSLGELVGIANQNIIPAENLDRDYVVYPDFDTDKCIGCGRCYISCYDGAHQAISWDEENRKPSCDHEKCVGCHLCVLVCPVHAIDKGEVVMKPGRSGSPEEKAV